MEWERTSGVFAGAFGAFDEFGEVGYDVPGFCLWAGDGSRKGEGGEEDREGD
jgi:hypothetical protein